MYLAINLLLCDSGKSRPAVRLVSQFGGTVSGTVGHTEDNQLLDLLSKDRLTLINRNSFVEQSGGNRAPRTGADNLQKAWKWQAQNPN
jgi:hypothetical protein